MSARQVSIVITAFLREQVGHEDPIPLHEPFFDARDLSLVEDCVRSGWVSSAGKYVEEFEQLACRMTGAAHAIAVVNGTAALQLALHVAGVAAGDLVLCPSLTFVATANAISHCNAQPLLIDSEPETLGLCVKSLRDFLENRCTHEAGQTLFEGRRVAACVPVHVFGHAARIDEIVALCREHGVRVIEDATEALGSTYAGKALGTFGDLGVFSFNGNKIITTGGGGMIVTNDTELAHRARHLSTTAKIAHPWKFVHDEVAWNFRLPNLNAALGCAQMQKVPEFVCAKRQLASEYRNLFADLQGVRFIDEPPGCISNFWLNGLQFDNRKERDAFITATHEQGILTRACWEPMHLLAPYADAPRAGSLEKAEFLATCIANIPSSPALKMHA